MPYARAMWFSGHQIVSFQQIYLSPDPSSAMLFPLSSVGAGAATVMSLGSWFGWQLLFLALSAGALTWLVHRCAGLSGWKLTLVSALVMAGTAPARVAVGQGTLDLLMVCLLVAGLWPRRPATGRGAVAVGLAAAVWIGPLVAIVALIAGGLPRGWRRLVRLVRAPQQRFQAAYRGLVALGVALFITLCALFALPWATNDYWWLIRRGAAGVGTGLDPSLGARAGLAGWILGGLLAMGGLLSAAVQVRAGRIRAALVYVCLAMAIGLPAQFAGQGAVALVVALVLVRTKLAWPQRAAVAAWAGWTCLVPVDLVAQMSARGVLGEAALWVGPVMGCCALCVIVGSTLRERLA